MTNETDLLTGLLQHASPSGHEAEAVTWLVAQMQAAGLNAEVDAAGNAVGWCGDGPATVMLLGHIDTVPGHIPVRTEGDLLYGRGAVDAKGPLAAFVAAVAALTPPAGVRFVVVGAVGEETDSRGAAYVRDQYRPDYLIIGEPSGWDKLTLGYKGSAWYTVHATRAMTHGAAADATAPERVVGVWQRIQAACAQHNSDASGVFNELTPILAAMHSEGDGLAERAVLRIGFRLPPGVTVADVTALTSTAAGEDATVAALPGAVPAYRAQKNTALVRAALSAIRANGGEPRFTVKTGTSDMNLVAPQWQCPTLAYGPGDSALDHTPDEHISLSEYRRGIAVLRALLTDLAKRAASN